MNGFIKIVLFDLDDTLYDERTFVTSGFNIVATYLASKFGLDKQQVFSAMMTVLTREGRGRIFDRVLLSYGLYSPELVTELVNIYRSHLPQISLYPDVQPSFRALKQRGARLGIVTDGLHEVQKRKVSALGLCELMDVIIYTDELGKEHWKPHPLGFQHALKRLSATSEDALYVGNDPVKDFAGPKSIGMYSVHLCRNSLPEKCSCEADAHITKLTQLIQVILERGKQ